MNHQAPSFLKQAGKILNSGQARTLLLTGNIHDLFYKKEEETEDYVSLLPFLVHHWDLPNFILVIHELNGPIRFLHEDHARLMKQAWVAWRTGLDSEEIAIQRMLNKGNPSENLDAIGDGFDQHLKAALSNPTLALELLRQMCLCSRSARSGKPILKQHLLIIVEGADLLLPESPMSQLSDVDRQRVAICQDWFSDQGFLRSQDSVILLAESRSLIHHRIAKLPYLLESEIPSPDTSTRRHFISWYNRHLNEGEELKLWSTQAQLATLTAGISLQALLQLLKGAAHAREKLQPKEVVAKVEGFIQNQLGDSVVEFKKPEHRLKDVVGFTQLKGFLNRELIPRFQVQGPAALPGAAVCGPIGSGKTFIFEAVASELDMVVLVLKNLRSQWFGQTDVVFERLKRVLEALSKVLIFVDEADTQFGSIGANAHETERRLTGKIQAMMSDPRLKGRVFWLLITARIHLLSPDLRRPGRVGDLIIPVLDPDEKDRMAFIDWLVKPVLAKPLTTDQSAELEQMLAHHSAAAMASLRSELLARQCMSKLDHLDFTEIVTVVRDHLPAAIESTRHYQTLQALIHCSRRSMLPDPHVTEKHRAAWDAEIKQLESQGIR
ncbi:MAG: ATP-binding protein [Verrucomicrobiota bacterium]|nr:ATP-binding protein [Verrucomicrobiota bacterium]